VKGYAIKFIAGYESLRSLPMPSVAPCSTIQPAI